MSHFRDAIIREFSSFCRFQKHDGYERICWQRDRKLEHLLQSLTWDAPEVPLDVWARYLLLLFQPGKSPQMEGVEVNPFAHLTTFIHQLANLPLQPNPNQYLPALHRHLMALPPHLQLQTWQIDPASIAKEFLTAYLQKRCLFAAQAFYRHKLALLQGGNPPSLEECFQQGVMKTIDPAKLLKNFQFDCPNQVKTYAEVVLKGIIQETMQRQYGLPVSSSEWRLLRYISKRELQAALRAAGKQARLSHYCLLWQCYQEIYDTRQEGQKPLPPPTDLQLQAMGDRYNQRRWELHLDKPIAEPRILSDLQRCARAIRDYQSLDAVEQSLDDITHLPDTLTADPFDQLLQTEQAELATSVRSLAEGAIASTIEQQTELIQLILRLNLGLGFTQQEIQSMLKWADQSKVCRYKNKYKQPLMKGFLQVLRQQYPMALPTDATIDPVIKAIQAALDEYLVQHCKNYFHALLMQQWQQFSDSERNLLIRHYQRHLAWEQIAAEQHQPVTDLSIQLNNLTQQLRLVVRQLLASFPAIDLSVCDSVDQRLHSFVEAWLEHQAMVEN